MQENERLCGLCGASARRVHADFPGYRAGTTYTIYACASCGCSFADPMAVDGTIYEDIYRDAAQVPGYARYVDYAQLVAQAADPLTSLANEEDVYWAVVEALRERPQWQRVLEIGSGFGYLTYALSRSGFVARGIDLSEKAVGDARRRYGDLFEVSDVAALRQRTDFEGWDALVCTELIEHVPALHEFIASAIPLLRPGGGLIITTPNKSFYPAGLVWGTDLPPVHLWWFSENAIREIAQRHGCTVRFVDFTAFNRTHLRYVPVTRRSIQMESRIDAAGKSLAVPQARSALWRALRIALRIPGVWQVVCRLTGRRKVIGSGGPAICAVLTPN
jgi:SAM-dependent methyltransferase